MTVNSPSRLLAYLGDLRYSMVPLRLCRSNPKWRELNSFPFAVKTSFWMTERDYDKWRRSMKMAAKAVKKHKIPVTKFILHHHWINRNCDLGVADDSTKTIQLCDTHPETALHELAHLWSQDYHTKQWARLLFLLHREFLSREEIGFYQKEAMRMYKTAKEVVETEHIGKLCLCGRPTR